MWIHPFPTGCSSTWGPTTSLDHETELRAKLRVAKPTAPANGSKQAHLVAKKDGGPSRPSRRPRPRPPRFLHSWHPRSLLRTPLHFPAQVAELEEPSMGKHLDENATANAVSSKRFKRICVFCGSSRGKKGIFSDVAFTLGQELVNRKIDLVYGGGGNGLMGHVAQSVHDGGGHVVGVIPKALIGQEISGQTVGKLVAVSDMHQRKAEMARQADAFIALPGGYGTLEELLEVITWSQLGIHEKPVGLLNIDGYYNPLLALFDKALEEGFLKFPARSIVVSARTPSELLDKLEAYTPIQDPRVPKLCWENAECLVYAPAVSNTTAQ